MKKHVLRSHEIIYSRGLPVLEDISEEQARMVIEGQANPPLWQIGHLLHIASTSLTLMGKEPVATEEEAALFGNGSIFDPAGEYPRFEDLLKRYRDACAARVEAFKAFPEETFDRPIPKKSARQMFPTIGDALVFMMTSHEAYHFAQVTAWKRALSAQATG